MDDENMMKNELLHEKIEQLQNEISKSIQVIKELEAKSAEANERIENLENKNNEITKRAK